MTSPSVSRRRFLEIVRLIAGGAIFTGAGGLAPGAQQPSSSRAGTRLILLGTAGGPRPKADRAASSQVILTGGKAYVVDCGDGVAQRLAAARVDLQTLTGIFVTHHHSDHNADYGNLLLLAWTVGLRTPVGTYGPPPLAQMTQLFFELNAYDIETRIRDEGRPPLAPLVIAREVEAPGVVLADDRVRVRAALVRHPPVTPALAYRFDTPDRSIVISGDTAWSDELLELARGADVLVHEALYTPAVDRLVARVPNAPRLRAHILASHTAVEDVGRLAARAGVGTLVLSHLVPADDPAVTDADWIAAAATHFRGTIVVGRDLLEI